MDIWGRAKLCKKKKLETRGKKEARKKWCLCGPKLGPTSWPLMSAREKRKYLLSVYGNSILIS